MYPSRGDTPQGRDELLQSQVLIPPAAAAMVAPARVNRLAIILRNLDPTGAAGPDLWVGGDPGVTAADGAPLNSGVLAGIFGDAVTLETSSAIWVFNPGPAPVPCSVLETASTG
jgi:hypothetical protein